MVKAPKKEALVVKHVVDHKMCKTCRAFNITIAPNEIVIMTGKCQVTGKQVRSNNAACSVHRVLGKGETHEMEMY